MTVRVNSLIFRLSYNLIFLCFHICVTEKFGEETRIWLFGNRAQKLEACSDL